jgi:magnesium chelatase family protein
VAASDLSLPPPAEDSREIAARVCAARALQQERSRTLEAAIRPSSNAELDGQQLEELAAPDASGRALLGEAAEKIRLTARGYHRVLRVARTLADLEGKEAVRRIHIAEALSYRRLSPGR